MLRLGKRRFRIAALDETLGEQIALAACVKQRGIAPQRIGRFERMRQRCPVDGEVADIERGHRGALACDKRHRLAAKTRFLLRQRRLVGKGRDRRRNSFCPEYRPP